MSRVTQPPGRGPSVPLSSRTFVPRGDKNGGSAAPTIWAALGGSGGCGARRELEVPAAASTDIKTPPHVRASVADEVRAEAEAPAALGARVRPLPRVRAGVLGQRGAARKGPAAVRARVWARRVGRRCWRLARDLRGEGGQVSPDREAQEPETGGSANGSLSVPGLYSRKSHGACPLGRLCALNEVIHQRTYHNA